MPFLKSPEVAKKLGLSYWQLVNHIRSGHIVPPAKDSSGDYFWLPEDVAAARNALRARRKKRELATA
jgi:hypothetical protein